MKKSIIASIVLIGLFCSSGSGYCTSIIPQLALLLLNKDDASPKLQGHFLDSKVVGIPYRTESLTGITDANGMYQYRAGESVEFYMGVTSLGTVQAKPTITPQDLAGSDADLFNNKSARIAQTLQSLDDDRNPTNGITISSQTRNNFSSHPLNFDVERDTSFIENLLAFTSESLGQEITVDLSASLGHLQATLDTLNEDCPYFSNLVGPRASATVPYSTNNTCTDRLRLYAYDRIVKRNMQFHINLINDTISSTINHHDHLEKIILGLAIADAASKGKDELEKLYIKEGALYLAGKHNEYVAEYAGAVLSIADLMLSFIECDVASAVTFDLTACRDFLINSEVSMIQFGDEVLANLFLNSYLEQINELQLTDFIIRERFKYGHDVQGFRSRYGITDNSLDTMITELGKKLDLENGLFTEVYEIEEVKTLLNMQLKLVETFIQNVKNMKNSKLQLTQEAINNNDVTVSWEWTDLTFIPDGSNGLGSTPLTLRCTSADSQYPTSSHLHQDLTVNHDGSIIFHYSRGGVKNISCEVTDQYGGIHARQTMAVDIGNPDLFYPTLSIDTISDHGTINRGDTLNLTINGTDNRKGLRVDFYVADSKQHTVVSKNWQVAGNSFTKTIHLDTSNWIISSNPNQDDPWVFLQVFITDGVGHSRGTNRIINIIDGPDQSPPTALVTEGIVANGKYPVGHKFSLLIEAVDDKELQELTFNTTDAAGNLVTKTWTLDTRTAVKPYTFSTAGWPQGGAKYWLTATDTSGKTFRSADVIFTLGEATAAQTDPTARINGLVDNQIYTIGRSFALMLTGTADELYKMSFHVKPPGEDTIKQSWFVTGTSVEEEYSFSTAGWSAGTAYYTLFVKNTDGIVGQEHGSFTVQAAATDGTVTSAGLVWMDRNLGASRVATNIRDTRAYGDLYQWGRGSDGHERRLSPVTSSKSSTDVPGHGNFITTPQAPRDWRSTPNDNLWQGVSGINNPCPSGFRLPTDTELNTERLSWVTYDDAGIFASPAKLVMGGYRRSDNAIIDAAGSDGLYWSSTTISTRSRYLLFNNSHAVSYDTYRTNGLSVRCIQDSGPLPVCDANHLDLCSTQSLCTGAGGVWSDSVCTSSGTEPGTVVSAGQVWMDRNLGASRVATSSTDSEAYGDLYQWGRGMDGHEKRSSTTTTTNSTTDVPGHTSFIVESSYPDDWRNPQKDNLWQGVSGINNPCPSGFRLPTATELDTERLSWNSINSAGAFASPLKLVVSGYRYHWDGTLTGAGIYGSYWSCSVENGHSLDLSLAPGNAIITTTSRADGYSVRCLKD